MKKITCLLLFLSTAPLIYSQETVFLNRIANVVNYQRTSDSLFLTRATTTLSRQPAQEKVYLHLDKPNYSFGDTIWYKAYTVIGQKHQLSALSGVLYVELISPKDTLVTRQALPLASGVSWSEIPLDHTLKQGTYRLRAYTRWMRNKPEYIDEQKIRIGGIAPQTTNKATTEPLDIRFFPEGGELVNGVRSRVAVKCTGMNGLGEDIKGTIQDNTGNIVADFTTQHLGMGTFALIPEAGKTYKAIITLPGESKYTTDLPKAKTEGYTLTINNNEPDSIYLKISTNEETLNKQKGQSFYIIAQSNGKVYYTTEGKLESLSYIAQIPKSKFPEGITQFTLFSQSGEPIAERIAFINNKADELKVGISPIQTPGQKTTLNITATDQNNKGKQGTFSVSVISESKVQPDENDESSIINNLLLTSELKGYIEQPNYYFTNISEQTNTALDNLMLTQGYRRYEWKQILDTTTNNTAIKYPPERSQEISGILTTPGGKPVPNGKITLAAVKEKIFRDTTADEEGHFTFNNLYISDTTTLVLRARKANKGSNVLIKAIPPDYPKIEPTTNTGNIPNTDTLKAQQQYKQYQQDQKIDLSGYGRGLKTVNIVGLKKAKKPDMRFSANLHGGGNADQVIMYTDLGPCVSIGDCLGGKIRGVTIYRSSSVDGTIVALNNGRSPMSIILDGQVLPPSYLSQINTDEVYSIEVLRSGFATNIYGRSISGGGALVITTKRGTEWATDLYNIPPAGVVTLKYKGFHKTKAFYQPKYAPKADSPGSARSTIYWNPNMLTDKDGKASLDYFTPDVKGTYRVVIEGIDDDGNLARQVYRYEIK
ncbi:carboxypeptidase-like regulatory domain-containing protein [Mucilaginibacter ginsenosidivorans]|uniref:TonB-dependent receptor n=1 Tax=Mucilaginibacter ginsenosidivorans TaxID=398053 RepID=A0A5B8UW26_9SPHI|nr:carboxypeptidase-like regulatory domain-containing protein [Mucilaginibacter ginsenosidivorans]QEC63109.1 TonB-dependent receptor [Mucilaginibacter ginsenosidivorans]